MGSGLPGNEMDRPFFTYDLLLTPRRNMRVTKQCNLLRSHDTAAHGTGVVHEKTDCF